MKSAKVIIVVSFLCVLAGCSVANLNYRDLAIMTEKQQREDFEAGEQQRLINEDINQQNVLSNM